MEDQAIPAIALRVLLVEDSHILNDRLGEVLRGLEAVDLAGVVDSEASAVEFLKQGSVDVVILDLHLKQGSGFGVLRQLAAAHIKPQIIVFTNYDLPEYKQNALALGATHFLDKAHDFGMLPGMLRNIHLTRGNATR